MKVEVEIRWTPTTVVVDVPDTADADLWLEANQDWLTQVELNQDSIEWSDWDLK